MESLDETQNFETPFLERNITDQAQEGQPLYENKNNNYPSCNTKAEFELQLLNGSDYPEEAVRASRAAFDTLVVLLNEVQDYRNKSM